MKSAITLLILTFLSAHLDATTPNAFCHYPVVDLVGTSETNSPSSNNAINSYDRLPCSGNQSNPELSRVTQLLFNEQVQILEESDHEVKVKIFHWYHQIGNPAQKVDTYFAPKKHFTYFKNISPDDKIHLPIPVSFLNHWIPQNNTITLIDSYYDKKSHTMYSAGTRFIKEEKQPKDTTIIVHRYDAQLKKTTSLALPKDICTTTAPTTNDQKRETFVATLKQWAYRSEGIIPYVLGGASVGFDHSDDENIKVKKSKNKTLYYRFKNKKRPYYGLDCAHMIARAAQIANIPLFVKNTTTLRATYPTLKEHESIENGDIIVWRGHTVVISDTEKGLIIEARGYDHGYGKVQEIQLSEQFKGIKTIDQLRDAYFSKRKIIRLNKAGDHAQIIDDLIIIKLPVD